MDQILVKTPLLELSHSVLTTQWAENRLLICDKAINGSQYGKNRRDSLSHHITYK